MNRLNKILVLVFGAVALISCKKLSVSDIRFLLPGEIYFAKEDVVVDTKAFIETTDDILQTNGFNVAAIIDDSKSVMFNKAVTYDNGVYSVSGEKYYWPETGTMSFYCVYPNTQAVTVTSGAATLAYSHNTDTDLIVAKKIAVSGSSGAVSLAFEHLLSQVNIKAKGKETTVDYKVFSVKITDANGGTYTYADGTWTPSSTTQAYTVYNNASGMAVSTSSMTAVGSAMSFVPGNAELNVVWKCYNKGSSTVLYEKDVTVDITLPQGMNSTLNLTLPFNSSGLTFDTTIGSWVNKESEIEMEEPVAKYSVSALAGSTVTLPKLNINEGTNGKIDWGDGTIEPFSNVGTKSSVADDKITFSHTYINEFEGEAKIYVDEGKIFGEVSVVEYAKFTVSNTEKVNLTKPIVFTVNESGKTVKFAPANLFWNGEKFIFLDHQYSATTKRYFDNDVDHFFWSKSAQYAYYGTYLNYGISTSDNLFAVDGGAIEGFTVLSKDEWDYVLTNAVAMNSSSKTKIMIASNSCIVLKPDGFNGIVADSYTAKEWEEAEKSGLVALPMAGLYSSGSNIYGQGGYYWTSTPDGDDAEKAWGVQLGDGSGIVISTWRSSGYCIRLVQVIDEGE